MKAMSERTQKDSRGLKWHGKFRLSGEQRPKVNFGEVSAATHGNTLLKMLRDTPSKRI